MYWTERIIILIVVAISLGSLFFVPRTKIRDAVFIFLFTQIPSWVLGLFAVQMGWLDYPVRDFHKANDTSFTYEFLVLPITTIHFILHYPSKKAWWKGVIYAAAFCGIFTVLELLIENYTQLIRYNQWRGYWTFLSLLGLYYLIRVVYLWYFKTLKPRKEDTCP